MGALRERAALTRWYATSPVPEWIAHRSGMDPVLSMVHAKKLGTEMTACGRRASGWARHWKAFHLTVPGRACPDCSSMIGLHAWKVLAP